jgi:hypothetical protein
VVGKTTPTIPFNTPQCLLKEGPSRVHRCDVPLTADSDVVPYNRIIAGLGRRAPRVTVVDATPFICPAGVCPAIMDGVVVHRDDDHLSATFARTVAAQFEALLAASGVLPR